MDDSRIDAALFRRLFADVAAVGRGPRGWTRPPWSEEVRRAEEVVVAAAEPVGLVPSRDGAGNLWLTARDAPETELVAAGSHLDTVPEGGAFDGTLGVVSALVAVSALRARRTPQAERLAVVSFADEEGWRFGTPLFGSRLLTGGYDAAVLERRDAEGVRLGDVATVDPGAARGGHGRLAAFVEVHVEQGRALAPAQAPLGVAAGLAARARWAFAVEGQANHAGTTPMAERRDALVAAARLVLDADALARVAPPAVATVGRLDVEPGGSNVIPGRVRGTLDVRAPDAGARDALLSDLRARHPAARWERLSVDDGARFDVQLRAAAHAAAARREVRAVDLASFAGHDAGALAAAGVPAVMLFVRSPNGISHDPAEHAEEADALAGCVVLADVLETALVR